MRKPMMLGPFLALATALATGPASAEAPEPPRADDPPLSGITRLQVQALEGRRQPVVGAVVVVRDEGDPGRIDLVTTDVRGTSKVADLPDGLYQVTFRKPGYATVLKADVEVRAPLRTVIEVPMKPGDGTTDVEPDPVAGEGRVSLRGRVADVGDRPLADVRVRAVHGPGRYDPREVRTVEGGAFRFDDLPVGVWHLEVTAVGYLPIRTPVRVDRALDARVRMVAQPADYVASPLDLMPRETPIPPPDLEPAPRPAGPGESTGDVAPG